MRLSCLDWDRLEDALRALSAEAIHLPPSAAADAVTDRLRELGNVLRDIEQEAEDSA